MQFQGIGLGTFPFSNVFGRVTEDEASRIVHTFLDGDGTYIQTAPYYDGVDPLVARALSGTPRESYYLATLCVKDRQSQLSGRRESVLAQCDDSLRQLKTDCIDLYLTSTPEANDAPYAETIETMLELQQQGKIRALGVCNVTLDQLRDYNSSGAVACVQNRLSIIDQSADADVRDFCAHNNIGLVPYNVIEWGILTDKSLRPWQLRPGDLRTQVLPVFEEEKMRVLTTWIVEQLKPIADDNATSIEALAIHWALSQPGVAVAPVGATTQQQILASLKALELRERTDIINQMNKAYRLLEERVRSTSGLALNDFLRNSYGKW